MVTRSEIGTMFVNRRIHVKKVLRKSWMYSYHFQSESRLEIAIMSRYEFVFSSLILIQTVEKAAPIKHRTHSIRKMIKIDFVMSFSSLENFYLDPIEFFMILVSCPAKVTTPMTQSVFLRLDPLSSKFSAESEILSPVDVFISPSNL